jgi:hypothetical protein
LFLFSRLPKYLFINLYNCLYKKEQLHEIDELKIQLLHEIRNGTKILQDDEEGRTPGILTTIQLN